MAIAVRDVLVQMTLPVAVAVLAKGAEMIAHSSEHMAMR